MPTIQQTLTEPNTGADLTRLNAFLDYLATKLSASDFKIATDLLWAAFHSPVAARLNREAA